MKTLLTAVLLLTASLLSFQFAPEAKAQSTFYGTSVRMIFSSTNVGPTDWVPVISSLPRSIGCYTITTTSPIIFQIGTASAGSTANAEVQRQIVPGTSPGTICYPLQVSAGMRVSIRAYTSTASAGEGQFNFFYN